MKRIAALLLAAALLGGCAYTGPGQKPPDTGPTETAGREDVPEVRLYRPGSDAEEATGGSVRAYPLSGVCFGMRRQGSDLLLFTGESAQAESGSLIRISGENGTVKATASIECLLRAEDPSLRVAADRVGFYSPAAREMVFLDGDLRETGRTPLPGDLFGTPALSQDMETVYYSTGTQIRAMELESGNSRLMKQYYYPVTDLLGVWSGDGILVCGVTEPDGKRHTDFLSTVNGRTLYTDPALLTFFTCDDACFLTRRDGSVTERLFRQGSGREGALYPAEEQSDTFWLPEGNGALTVRENGDALSLELYDLESGKRTAAITLSGVGACVSAAADGDAVWLLCRMPVGDTLYRWDTGAYRLTDTKVYTAPRYTADAPDTEGLAECAARGKKLAEERQVKITFAAPVGIGLTPEYQTAALRRALDCAEAALDRFPEDFFRQLASITPSGMLNVVLCREISGGSSSAHFWQEGDAYIVLAIGENMDRDFYHELSFALDSYLLGRSSLLDGWAKCNPKGFSYDYSYDLYERRGDSPWLSGDGRAFIDSLSMTYPTEDRARIWEYALTEGSEAYFAAPVLQEKLSLLCRALRDAFGWKDIPEAFPWEQYLEN